MNFVLGKPSDTADVKFFHYHITIAAQRIKRMKNVIVLDVFYLS